MSFAVFMKNSCVRCVYCGAFDIEILHEENLPSFPVACPKQILSDVEWLPFQMAYCHTCSFGFNAKPLSVSKLRKIYRFAREVPVSGKLGVDMISDFSEFCESGWNSKISAILLKHTKAVQARNFKNLSSKFDNLSDRKLDPLATRYVIHDPARVVLSWHLLEHIKNLRAFFESVRKLQPLKLLIEVPRFQSFHHEHLNYFNSHFLYRLARDYQLKLSRLQIHDQMLRAEIVSRSSRRKALQKKDLPAIPFGEIKRYRQLKTAQLRRIKNFFRAHPRERIVIWGSGRAAINTLGQLEFGKKDARRIKLVDKDPGRVGMYIPGAGLKIQSLDTLNGQSADVLIIASSFVQDIKKEAARRDFRFSKLEIIRY